MDRLDNDLITFGDEEANEIKTVHKRSKMQLTHEEFVEKMAQLQPNLIVISNYINKRTKVRCRC
jgi:hypothetical protein